MAGTLWVEPLARDPMPKPQPGARRTLFLRGEAQYWSERCISCFDYDLGRMMRYDLEGFLRQEESLPDKVERIIAFVRQWAKRDEGPLSTIGLMYPSLGL